MKTIRTVIGLRAELAAVRRAGRRIGLVPTMGAFHDGHLSLMREARERCEVVVVSLFVNPTQFNEQADLASYPRDEARDVRLASAVGVDYLFAPSAEEMYPEGFCTTVSVAGVTEQLEGAQRGRAHFDGVTTVVTKLLNIVRPDVAYFGQKDAQQVAVIKRVVDDLEIPVELVVCPTVREPDGLAMSSRNARLSAGERERAATLARALRAAADAITGGERNAALVTNAARAALSQDVELEYFELVQPDTFEPIRGRVDSGDVLAVAAVWVGTTRLIDNQPIHLPSTATAITAAGSTPRQEDMACSARC
jgi:pantoate--beta-alanine ligase